ncbi:MAG TPA: PAS domain S-box protein [Verrucomicrobiae bacterium]|nr:PAS domain S-box protein [Verrucomicrobiae bacterium]
MLTPIDQTMGHVHDGHSVPARLRVLILEDNQRDAELFIQKLKEAGCALDADTVDSEDAFVASLRSRVYDLILSDYSIPEWSGLEAFRFVKRSGINIPFILVTGTLGEEAAVDLIKEGVADYILKDRLARLPSAVRRALQEKLIRDEAGRARHALHDSEEKVRLLLDSTAEAIYGINLEGNCTFCNPACARLLGYDNPSDLLGKQMHSLSHHARVEGTPRSIDNCPICLAARAGRGIHLDERALWAKDGSSFPAECWSHPMLQDGKSIGSVVTFFDITERKQIEDNLRRVAAVVESSQDAIISQTLDGIILTWNLGAEQIYGYSRAEMLGKSLAMIVPPDRQSEFHGILKKISWGEKVEQLQTVRVKKDGTKVHISLSVSSIKDANGKIVGASAIARDITETKHLEEMFLQAQKMEAVGRLAGGVAHDFNNLLGVIIGYSDIVEGRLKEDDPVRAKVLQIKKAGQGAARLTRQLLAFSRQQILDSRILDLNSVVTDVQKMLQRLIGADVEMVTSLCPDLAPMKADQGQIEQVIMNLIVNSRDAMPDGGTLTIETSNVELDALYVQSHPELTAGSFVMLAVTDTGTGIDPEIQKHIFEPFFTTKEQGKGTGLGLSTVYGVVKQSGGSISVSSEVGRGTTFRIYLPQTHAVAERDSVESKRLFEGTETVLVVEDEESLRKLTCEMLLENHYSVLEASNGFEAHEISQLHEGPIHLLLTDVVMPRISGPSLAKSLVARHPNMKVLYMSGYMNSSVVQELAISGSEFLQKPFTSDTLTRKVREILGATVLG